MDGGCLPGPFITCMWRGILEMCLSCPPLLLLCPTVICEWGDGGGGEQEARKEWRNLLQGQSLSGKHLTALVNSACARAWLSAGLRSGVGLGCAAWPSPVFHSCAPIFDKLASNRIAAQLSSNLMASGQPQDLLESSSPPLKFTLIPSSSSPFFL